MKYFIGINQYGVCKYELEYKTDLIDWAIIDYIKSWFFYENRKIYQTEDGTQYVWVNFKALLENLPLLSIKENTLTERFKKLRTLGLIKTMQMKDNTLYVVLTEYCMNVIDFSCQQNFIQGNLPQKTDQPTPEIGTDLPRKSGQHNSTINNHSKEGIMSFPFSEIVDYLNKKTGKSYRHNIATTQKRICARFSEGFRLEDFKKVIDNKVKDWKDDLKMSEYLRPETLFGTKFESYLNAKTEPTNKIEQVWTEEKRKRAKEIMGEK